jgi:hypothetical protein
MAVSSNLTSATCFVTSDQFFSLQPLFHLSVKNGAVTFFTTQMEKLKSKGGQVGGTSRVPGTQGGVREASVPFPVRCAPSPESSTWLVSGNCSAEGVSHSLPF